MRIAITGSTGLIGHHAARAALRAGHEVVALVRAGPRGAEAFRGIERVQRVIVELTNGPSLTRALEGVDALIHCAAVYAYGASRSDEVARVNVDGTVAVLESAAAAGVARTVVTSSSVTRGSNVAAVPRTEADHLGPEPAPAYYRSKVAQEQAALEASERLGLPVVLALPTVVLGGPIARLGPSNAIVLRYLLDPTRSTYPGGCNVVDARDVGPHACVDPTARKSALTTTTSLRLSARPATTLTTEPRFERRSRYHQASWCLCSVRSVTRPQSPCRNDSVPEVKPLPPDGPSRAADHVPIERGSNRPPVHKQQLGAWPETKPVRVAGEERSTC
ncbi:MAG: NAD-dependent epimerase/dehydratase family protein [Micrococcales bacterium]|nr:NAD-dependent epimerase/dehydratase family protein [Micrococcales bacterium]